MNRISIDPNGKIHPSGYIRDLQSFIRRGYKGEHPFLNGQSFQTSFEFRIFSDMQVSENTLKWAMRFYPPLFFQRIWVKRFHKDFKGVEVKISKSLLNTNYNNSIFGGTIFSASDPFYALLFDQLLLRKGYKIRVWLKSAQISYLKPGHSNLYFKIVLTDDDIEEAETALKTVGKFVKAFPMEITGLDGIVCARVINEVYVRNLYKGEEETVAY